MNSVFDQFAKNYSEGHSKAVKASGFDPSYFHEYKLKEVYRYLIKNNFIHKKLNILNFGCGTGNSDPYIKKYIPNSMIYSIDVSEQSIVVAQDLNKNLTDVQYAKFNGIEIPFNIKFDIIFVANVFHHIPRQQHKLSMNEIFKHLNDEGILFLFELNPLNPLTVKVFRDNDLKFDPNANILNPSYTKKLLKSAGFTKLKTYFTIFFPKQFSIFIPFEKYLSCIPFGAHYYYIASKK